MHPSPSPSDLTPNGHDPTLAKPEPQRPVSGSRSSAMPEKPKPNPGPGPSKPPREDNITSMGERPQCFGPKTPPPTSPWPPKPKLALSSSAIAKVSGRTTPPSTPVPEPPRHKLALDTHVSLQHETAATPALFSDPRPGPPDPLVPRPQPGGPREYLATYFKRLFDLRLEPSDPVVPMLEPGEHNWYWVWEDGQFLGVGFRYQVVR